MEHQFIPKIMFNIVLISCYSLLCWWFNVTTAAVGEAPIITIPDGILEGISNTTQSNVTYYAYRGIPYARPPVDELRFAAPVQNDPWNGTLNATADRDICTQIDGLLEVIGSEDCLYINVYTKSVTDNLPVMVWIYGGSFTGGGSSFDLFNPEYLIEKDILYVAFNYRVGVFGFLSTEDEAAPGNFGLKDQILALQWIQNNIKYFGGDPTKITVFGESAGAASISYLLQTNLTTGLFRGAILESGTSLNLWALTRDARSMAFRIGAAADIITTNSTTLITQLRNVDYDTLKLIESSNSLIDYTTENLLAGLPVGVVQEPELDGAVFTSKSWELLATGQFQQVPLIVGFNSNEANSITSVISYIWPFVLAYDFDISRLAPYDLSTDDTLLNRTLASQQVRSHFFDSSLIALQEDALTTFVSVDQFERPIRELVLLASNYTNVYYYEFSYEGILGDAENSTDGVGHAEELNYLFSTTQEPLTESDQLTIDRFTTLWTNFVKTGNPTPTDTSTMAVLGDLVWEPNNASVDVSSTINYLNIGSNLTLSTNPFQTNWVFYQELYDEFGQPPYTTY